jgi:hypothetical protein
MMLALLQARIGHPALGWIIPGVVFLASFVLTWMIYRHFSKKNVADTGKTSTTSTD